MCDELLSDVARIREWLFGPLGVHAVLLQDDLKKLDALWHAARALGKMTPAVETPDVEQMCDDVMNASLALGSTTPSVETPDVEQICDDVLGNVKSFKELLCGPDPVDLPAVLSSALLGVVDTMWHTTRALIEVIFTCVCNENLVVSCLGV